MQEGDAHRSQHIQFRGPPHTHTGFEHTHTHGYSHGPMKPRRQEYFLPTSTPRETPFGSTLTETLSRETGRRLLQGQAVRGHRRTRRPPASSGAVKEQAGAEPGGAPPGRPPHAPRTRSRLRGQVCHTNTPATRTCALWPQPSHHAKRRAKRQNHSTGTEGDGPAPPTNCTRRRPRAFREQRRQGLEMPKGRPHHTPNRGRKPHAADRAQWGGPRRGCGVGGG